jgi:hypothetical protein
MKRKRKERDYIKIVEEMAELVDTKVKVTEAIEILNKKYKLNEKEGKDLMTSYVSLCEGEKYNQEEEIEDPEDLDDLEELEAPEDEDDDDLFRDY